MRPADDPQVVASRLQALGCRRGAFLLLLNAAAQREAAQVRDLPQAPRSRRRVVAQPQPHAPNDNHPATPSETA